MLLCIESVLPPDSLREVRTLLASQKFVDGKESAGWAAARVKNNRQLDARSPDYARLQTIVSQALSANEIFILGAMPKVMRPLLFSRYDNGMGYGNHVDNVLMGEDPRMRTDVSFTVFLNEPDQYEGGELVIEDVAGTQSIKLPAGSVVLYPSSFLHRVDTVTSGSRLVAVGWIQSLIRDSTRRQIIFELETLRRQIFLADGKAATFDTLSKNVSNLWRMWIDP